jgi:uncharacterized OB-fold protein
LLNAQDNMDRTGPEAMYQVSLDQGVFALPTCVRCDRAHYSPRVLCPHCGSDSIGWRKSLGRGVVYSTSMVTPRGAEPYAVVLVELDEGPRLMSNLVGMPADQVQIGMRVRVRVQVRNDSAVALFEEERS